VYELYSDSLQSTKKLSYSRAEIKGLAAKVEMLPDYSLQAMRNMRKAQAEVVAPVEIELADLNPDRNKRSLIL
jgi:hypothetical protein